jgi:methylthioribulose-1-phosphate dehydratase
MSSANAVSQQGAPPSDPEVLILSADPLHPANLIPTLCSQFYTLGWVTGTGGGTSMRLNSKTAHRHRSPSSTDVPHADSRDLIYIAPSGVQKERMQARDLFVMTLPDREYLRKPPVLSPSACTPLFLAAFEKRGAGCCIHTHSQWAVLVTLLTQQSNPIEGTGDKSWPHGVFEIEKLEQIKGIAKGPGKAGSLSYFDTLRIPIIENTAR